MPREWKTYIANHCIFGTLPFLCIKHPCPRLARALCGYLESNASPLHPLSKMASGEVIARDYG